MQSTRATPTQTKSVTRLLSGLLAAACAIGAATPEYRLQVVHIYPHDRTSFTQGLEYHNGVLYEGTGVEGHSRLLIENLTTGKAIRQVPIAPNLFGEGISVLGSRVYQLTWLGGKGFVYEAATFRPEREFSYPGEGWGLTNDGQHLYMSDGTADIRVWDPSTCRELRRITVHDGDRQINMLNELEWVLGELWANVWQTDRIARISPTDGKVQGWIDCAGLLEPGEVTDPNAVLNGIAYDSLHDRIFITGKLWPKIFEVRLVPVAPK